MISGCAFLATFVLEHIVATQLMAKFTAVELKEDKSKGGSEKDKLLRPDPLPGIYYYYS